MRKIHLLTLLSVFLIQPVFADEGMMSDSRPCMDIAKACKKAGYGRHEAGDKRFWKDCMKPVMMGHSVKGVTIDADTIKSCRMDKIKAIKQELQELQMQNGGSSSGQNSGSSSGY